LKVWGIDSQNSIISGLSSVGGGNSVKHQNDN